MPITKNESPFARVRNEMAPSSAAVALALSKLGYTWQADVDCDSVRVSLPNGLVGYYVNFAEFEQDCYRSGVLKPIVLLTMPVDESTSQKAG